MVDGHHEQKPISLTASSNQPQKPISLTSSSNQPPRGGARRRRPQATPVGCRDRPATGRFADSRTAASPPPPCSRLPPSAAGDFDFLKSTAPQGSPRTSVSTRPDAINSCVYLYVSTQKRRIFSGIKIGILEDFGREEGTG